MVLIFFSFSFSWKNFIPYWREKDRTKMKFYWLSKELELCVIFLWTMISQTTSSPPLLIILRVSLQSEFKFNLCLY